MKLERKMVNIMDHENKEVVERFPVHLVREPTAFTSTDPKVFITLILLILHCTITVGSRIVCFLRKCTTIL